MSTAEVAKRALEEVFADTSVAAIDTKNRLVELREQIAEMIGTLDENAQRGVA